jgi:hypothetical protein
VKNKIKKQGITWKISQTKKHGSATAVKKEKKQALNPNQQLQNNIKQFNSGNYAKFHTIRKFNNR